MRSHHTSSGRSMKAKTSGRTSESLCFLSKEQTQFMTATLRRTKTTNMNLAAQPRGQGTIILKECNPHSLCSQARGQRSFCQSLNGRQIGELKTQERKTQTKKAFRDTMGVTRGQVCCCRGDISIKRKNQASPKCNLSDYHPGNLLN